MALRAQLSGAANDYGVVGPGGQATIYNGDANGIVWSRTPAQARGPAACLDATFDVRGKAGGYLHVL